MADIIELRKYAQERDLRNRAIVPEPQPKAPVCAISGCDGILTITDRGTVCRQCVIQYTEGAVR